MHTRQKIIQSIVVNKSFGAILVPVLSYALSNFEILKFCNTHTQTQAHAHILNDMRQMFLVYILGWIFYFIRYPDVVKKNRNKIQNKTQSNTEESRIYHYFGMIKSIQHLAVLLLFVFFAQPIIYYFCFLFAGFRWTFVFILRWIIRIQEFVELWNGWAGGVLGISQQMLLTCMAFCGSMTSKPRILIPIHTHEYPNKIWLLDPFTPHRNIVSANSELVDQFKTSEWREEIK